MDAGDRTPQATALAAWDKLCGHLTGIAIGSTVSALAERSVLQELSEAATGLPVDDLARNHNARRGYLHLAFMLLAAEGYSRRDGDTGRGDVRVALTSEGRAWARCAMVYRHAPVLIDSALALASGRPNGRWRRVLADAEIGTLDQQVWRHLIGCLVAAAAVTLHRHGAFEVFGSAPGEAVSLFSFRADPRILAEAIDVFALEGWARRQGDAVSLSPEGQVAAQITPQYQRPVAYLPLYRRVPALLFGDQSEAGGKEDETSAVDQLDRINVSGEVFRRTCREPFFDLALPLFDTDNIAAQPRYILDVGSGDGTMLAELYLAIRERTRRGRALESHPLLAIGAEFDPIARQTTAATLAGADIPHVTLFGDIGDPAGLAASLLRQGIDMNDALPISKSVIHNRAFRPAGGSGDTGLASAALAVRPDGALITGGELAGSLIALFARWRPWMANHGMIAIEAHAVEASALAGQRGRAVLVEFLAAHGYSNQHLVEIAVHRRAAEAAGLRLLATRDFGAELVGTPFLSIDHYSGGLAGSAFG